MISLPKMLKIKLPIPPYNEKMIKRFCDEIVEVKFDSMPNPISCIATVNQGADIENIASAIRSKSIFGKSVEVEVIEDDESLYQEHIEMDEGDDDGLSYCNDFDKNDAQSKQEGIDDETFVRLLQIRLRGPRPVISDDDIIEISSDSTEEDLDNEEVLSKIDDEANTFIHGLLEISNLYTKKNGEETPGSSNSNVNEQKTDKTLNGFDNFVSNSQQKPERNLKRPSDLDSAILDDCRILGTMNAPATDSSKKLRRSSLRTGGVPTKKVKRTASLNENELRVNNELKSKLKLRRSSFTALNGTTENDSAC